MSTSKSMSTCNEDDNELRRGPWTVEEDTMLSQCVASHGEGRWNLLAKRSGLRRTGKSCRLRWLNYLKPDVKRGNLTPEEQLLILELHFRWGNRWSKIAQHLPGRTDNEIKNYWRTRVQKQARHLQFHVDSIEFREFVRRFWIPRLLQKVKESSSSPILLDHQPFPLPLDTVNSQDSSIETASIPIDWQGDCMNEAHLNCLYQSEQNSDSEHNNSSYNSSLESSNIPLGYNNTSTSHFHGFDTSDLSSFVYGGYFVNNNGYEMETSNLEATRAAEDVEYPVVDSQVAESNCVNKDFAYTMYSMDELWQFRDFQK